MIEKKNGGRGCQKDTEKERVSEEAVELVVKDVKQGRVRGIQEYTSGSTRDHFIWSY